MPRPLHIGWLEPAAVGAVAVLLVLLATLQYRWVDQLARQEAESRGRAAEAMALALRDLLDDRLEVAAEALAGLAGQTLEPGTVRLPPALVAPMGEVSGELFWVQAPGAGSGPAVWRIDLARGGAMTPARWSELGQSAPGAGRILATEGGEALLSGESRAPVLAAPARVRLGRGPVPGLLLLPVDRERLEAMLAGRLAAGAGRIQPELRFAVTRQDAGGGGLALGQRRALADHPVAGYWRLEATGDAAGAAVESVRHRNLLLSGGIILLLGASAALLWAAARVSRRLADQRLEMVAGVSHELRTPLAVIHSAAANLADGVVGSPGRAAEYGELIRSEADRLRRLVDSALRMAGVAQQSPPAGRERARLDEALLKAGERLPAGRPAPAWDPAPAELAGTVVAMTPGDLHLVLSNLVVNTVVHASGARGAVVSTRVLGTRVVIETRNPAALEAGEAERLFEPFFRGRDARARHPEGSGMGLPIVRSIVERYGGRVSAREAGGRLVVAVDLPLAAGEAA